MATLDPSPMLTAAVSNDNAHQIFGAIQSEVTRFNSVLGQFQTSMNSELLQYKTSVGFEVSSLQGEVKTIKDGVNNLDASIKIEITKTNGIMAMVTERVKELGSAGGGVIDMSIHQMISQG